MGSAVANGVDMGMMDGSGCVVGSSVGTNVVDGDQWGLLVMLLAMYVIILMRTHHLSRLKGPPKARRR